MKHKVKLLLNPIDYEVIKEIHKKKITLLNAMCQKFMIFALIQNREKITTEKVT